MIRNKRCQGTRMPYDYVLLPATKQDAKRAAGADASVG